MKIKFTCEASPLITQSRIKRAVAKLLNSGRYQHFAPEWTEAVDVTEGAEQCGYGPLAVTGTVQQWNGGATVTYVLTNQGSQWRNYGMPSGCKHDVSLELQVVEVSNAAFVWSSSKI